MKNDSIKPIKRYEVGGASDDACMETVMVDGKPRRRRKKGCGYAKSQRVNKRRSAMNKVGEGVGKVVGGILGAAAAGAAGYGVKKVMDQQKKGGTVKKKYQAGGGASIVAAMKKGGAAKKKK
jgi:hypothetical protein